MSIDWRLFVPLENGSRIVVAGVAADEIASLLNRLGADAVAWDERRLDVGAAASSRAPFDIVAIPLGFAHAGPRAGHTTRVALAKARRLLKPGGTIVLGFDNPFAPRGKSSGRRGFSLRPARVVRAIEQTGYGSVRLYGALTGLSVPDYVFPLRRETLAFVIRRRFRGKVHPLLLGFLTSAVGLSMLCRVLPAYFVTAVSIQQDAVAAESSAV
jgi:SAM-dependent methyltransferase